MMRSEPLALTCPQCSQRSLVKAYHVLRVQIIKEQNWLICENCGFCSDFDQFKELVLCP